jgi:hypothetical protein
MALNTKTRKTRTPAGRSERDKRHGTDQATAPKAAPVPERFDQQVTAWFKKAPQERVPLAAMAGVYGAGIAMHAVHASPLGIAAATAVTMFGIAASRKIKDSSRAFKTYALTAGSGLWVAVAESAGVVGPSCAMAAGFGVLAGASYFVYRRDDVIKTRIEARKAREAWPAFAAAVGLSGSVIEGREDTRLGERITVNIKGTGKRASTLASGDVATRIAEHYRIPKSRVSVNEIPRDAVLISITIRRRDPWANAVVHPRLDPSPEITVPDVVDIAAGPAIVGQEPETGKPLTITLADEDGARRIMVIATPGSGKTVLLNDLMEWITASDNAVAWGADLTKAKDMRQWRDAGALDLAACGPEDTGKAALILAMAKKTIIYRAANNSEKTFTPAPGRPYIYLVLDEIDGLVGGQSFAAQKAREDLAYVVSKGRSEGVGVILVGQRGTAKWLGGADIRNIIDTIVLGTVARPGEVRMAIGDVDLDLPDMTKYGEGKKGVIVIKELFGAIESGRTFRLDDFADIRKIATGRVPTMLELGLLEHLGDAYLQAKGPIQCFIQGKAALEAAVAADATVSRLDAELEAMLPDDLRDQWQATAEKIDDAKRYAAELEPIEHDPRVDDIIAERRRQYEEQAKAAGVPTDVREVILRLAARPEGATSRELVAELNKGNSTVHRYMVALAAEGVVEMRGKGRGARWHTITDGSTDG